MTIHVKPSLKSFASGIREIATDGHGTDDSDCYREKCEYENSLWPESSFEKQSNRCCWVSDLPPPTACSPRRIADR